MPQPHNNTAHTKTKQLLQQTAPKLLAAFPPDEHGTTPQKPPGVTQQMWAIVEQAALLELETTPPATWWNGTNHPASWFSLHQDHHEIWEILLDHTRQGIREWESIGVL